MCAMAHVRVVHERHCRAPERDCLEAERRDEMFEEAFVRQLCAEAVLKNDKQALNEEVSHHIVAIV